MDICGCGCECTLITANNPEATQYTVPTFLCVTVGYMTNIVYITKNEMQCRIDD